MLRVRDRVKPLYKLLGVSKEQWSEMDVNDKRWLAAFRRKPELLSAITREEHETHVGGIKHAR